MLIYWRVDANKWHIVPLKSNILFIKLRLRNEGSHQLYQSDRSDVTFCVSENGGCPPSYGHQSSCKVLWFFFNSFCFSHESNSAARYEPAWDPCWCNAHENKFVEVSRGERSLPDYTSHVAWVSDSTRRISAQRTLTCVAPGSTSTRTSTWPWWTEIPVAFAIICNSKFMHLSLFAPCFGVQFEFDLMYVGYIWIYYIHGDCMGSFYIGITMFNHDYICQYMPIKFHPSSKHGWLHPDIV
jgi:hypothetical protein